MTVWRSLTRFYGTVIGALVGLVLVAFFAQTPIAMVAALCL